MTNLAFDTYNYAQKLIEVGFTEQQAQVQVEAMAELIKDTLASKHDLQLTEKNLRQEIKSVETSLKQEIKDVQTHLQAEIKEVETSLRQEIKDVHTSLQAEIKEVEISLRQDIMELRHQFRELENKLTIRLGGIMVVGIGILSIFTKFH